MVQKVIQLVPKPKTEKRRPRESWGKDIPIEIEVTHI